MTSSIRRLYSVYYAYMIVYFFKPWYYIFHFLPSYLFMVCLIPLTINVVFLPGRFALSEVDILKTKLSTDNESCS